MASSKNGKQETFLGHGLVLTRQPGQRVYLIHEGTGDVVTITASLRGPIRFALKADATKWKIYREELFEDPNNPSLATLKKDP